MSEVRQLKILTAQHFKKMVEYGLLNLKKHYQEVNDLNVFPVPDGDTGTNMRRTIETGFDVIREKEYDNISKMAQDLSKGMLLGARGNSCVILSQIFRGFSEGLQNKKFVSIIGLSIAFNQAMRKAYTAVVNPVEGTILTVIKEAVKFANSRLGVIDIDKYIEILYKKAKSTLPRTKSMLKALKEANVVDSGGMGLVYIFEGFFMYFEGKPIEDTHDNNISLYEQVHKEKHDQTIDLSLFNQYSVLDYGYCTEFILQLTANKVDVDNFDEQEVIRYLQTQGDSIVCFKDGTVIKAHVHTKDPGIVLAYVRRWGEFLTLKCENMSLQHNNVEAKKKAKIRKIHKNKAIVGVCQGDGMKEAYEAAGMDVIVDGNQTMNPSADDFIKAFDKIDSKSIYVLPNNSNIILAATQAKELYAEDHKDVQIYIIPTKSVAEGYIATTLLALNEEEGEEIIESVKDMLSYVSSFEVTRATKNTSLSGIKIFQSDFIGIMNHEVVTDKKNKVSCLIDMLKKSDTASMENLLLIYGKDVKNPDKARVIDTISKTYPNLAITEIDGGQDIYSFIGCLS